MGHRSAGAARSATSGFDMSHLSGPQLSERERLGFFDRLYEWMLTHLDRRHVDEIALFAPSDAMLDRVEEALALIREFDPIRYRHLCKDLDRIVVSPLHGPDGQFKPDTFTCEIDSHYVKRDDITSESIAAVIVHEAAHARLHRRGIGYPEPSRVRIEDFCVRQEWLFGHKLINGDDVRARADRYFDAPPPDLSNEAFWKRRAKSLQSRLQYLGLSEKWAGRWVSLIVWLGRMVAWLRRMRRRFRLRDTNSEAA
jgi:hypothetical protein